MKLLRQPYAAIASIGLLLSGALSASALAEEPPKSFNGFLGINLITSEMSDVINLLGEATLFELPDGHHDKGRCYQSADGLSVIFSSDPMGRFNYITGIQISDKPLEAPCTSTKKQIPNCYGSICLGQTIERTQEVTGKEFEKTNYGIESWVTGYEYNSEPSTWKLKRLKEVFGDDIPMADISQTLWVRFGENGADTIGTYKSETY